MNDKEGKFKIYSERRENKKTKQVSSLLGVYFCSHPMTEGMNYKLDLISNSKN